MLLLLWGDIIRLMSASGAQRLSIDSGTIVRFLGFIVLGFLIYLLRDIVMIFLAAVVIASAIEPATSKFERMKIPRILTVIMIYICMALFFVGIFYFFLPPLVDDIAHVVSRAPQYIESIQLWESGGGAASGFFGRITGQGVSISEVITGLQQSAQSIGGGAVGFLSNLFGGFLRFMLIVVLSFYLSVQKDGLVDFLKVVTPFQYESYVIGLWRRSQQKIGRWFQGQLILGLIVGVLVYLGLTILGVKSALLLAILAGLLELIPLFGPTLSAIPAIAIALIDGGVTLGLMVVGLYLIVQQFENHLIYPLVVKKVVGVPPLVVIISLVVGGQLAGFLGVLLAVPIVAAIMEYASDVQERKRKMHEAYDNNLNQGNLTAS